MTMTEKILARASGRPAVAPGEYIDCDLDGVLACESIVDVHRHLGEAGVSGGLAKVWDPEKLYLILEHHQPPMQIGGATRAASVRELAKALELPHFHDTTTGVCHQVMVDHGYALPGQLVVGSDSHTCMYGGLNCASTGIGELDLAFALSFGQLWFMVPESVRLRLEGTAPKWPVAKDVMLYLAGQHGSDFALYKSIEVSGPGAESLSMDGRFTIADHGVEVGAKFTMFEADDATYDFVSQRTTEPFDAVAPDPGATYAQEYTVDLSTLAPQVAAPHSFDNVQPVTELAGTKIDQGIVGSCANGRYEDIEITAQILEGRKVHDGVRLIVSPASIDVYRQCMRTGVADTILEAGGLFLDPGCSVCTGRRGYLAPGEVCLTATTRNYQGRIGSPEAFLYLANPATVAWSAVVGAIADPREVV